MHIERKNDDIVGLRDIIIVASFIWLISYFIHMPLAYGSTWIYSDATTLLASRGIIYSDKLLIPYRDYHFEYPPIVAIMFMICNLVVLLISPEKIYLRWLVAYTVMSIMLYLHAIGTIIILHKLIRRVNRRNVHILMFFILMPSFLIYTNYNWDLVGVFYALLGLHLFLNNRKVLSFVMFGLAAAGKIIPAIIALAPAIQVYLDKTKELRKKRKHPEEYAPVIALLYAFMYLLLTIVVFVILNLPFILVDFGGWYKGLILHHATWYIEDSWLILFFDLFDPRVRFVSIGLVAFFTMFTLYLLIAVDISREYRVIYGSAALMAGYLFSTYVYTPQMNLMILPFLVLVPIDYALVFIFDTLNSLIILTWFNATQIYRVLGIALEGGPLNRFSIPQICAWMRCLLLLTMLIHMYYLMLKLGRKSQSVG